MAPVEDGDGWDRPPTAPVGPRFEPAPLLGRPAAAPPRPPAPPSANALHGPAPPPRSAPPPGWVPPPGAPSSAPSHPEVGSGSRVGVGWIVAALVLVAMIPVGLVVAIVWLFDATSAAAADDPDGMSGEWLPLAAMFGFVAWAAFCMVAAAICALIGGLRARRT